MISKILNVALFGIASCLITYVTCKWWMVFGVREAYPYLATFMTLIMWGCTYLTATEKED